MKRKLDPEVTRRMGYEEGFKDGTKVVLDYLEKKYLAPDAPDRGSENAQYLLGLARDCAEVIGRARAEKGITG